MCWWLHSDYVSLIVLVKVGSWACWGLVLRRAIWCLFYDWLWCYSLGWFEGCLVQLNLLRWWEIYQWLRIMVDFNLGWIEIKELLRCVVHSHLLWWLHIQQWLRCVVDVYLLWWFKIQQWLRCVVDLNLLGWFQIYQLLWIMVDFDLGWIEIKELLRCVIHLYLLWWFQIYQWLCNVIILNLFWRLKLN